MEKKIDRFAPDKVFFTSDTHFGHENIIKFCNRPFSSVEEMNKALIENWNSVVSDDDIVFHLGDFAFGGSNVWNNAMNALKGKIYLIKGNHEFHNYREWYSKRFELVTSQMYIDIGGQKIYLNHFPFLCYGGSYRNEPTWQLFGHVHSGEGKSKGVDIKRLDVLFPTQYDVGVDNNNYFPVSFHDVQKKISKQIEKANK